MLTADDVANQAIVALSGGTLIQGAIAGRVYIQDIHTEVDIRETVFANHNYSTPGMPKTTLTAYLTDVDSNVLLEATRNFHKKVILVIVDDD